MKQSTILKRVGQFQKVVSLTSPRTGNTVANQVVIQCTNGTIFQSYESIIAVRLRTDGKLYVTDDFDYSKTTSKYLNVFCGYTAGEIKKELKANNKDIVILK